jgi:biotin-(acetyl-CoA carboxylase) ligase
VINQKILKKIGGQLIEKNEDFLILGVGFNVKNSPQLIDQPTICLDDLGKVINPFFLLHFFLKNFLSLFLSQKPNSFECLRQRWLKHALGYNVENAIMIDDCVDCFTFIDIAKDGALVLFNAKNNTFKRKYDIERIKFYTPSLIC